MIASKITSEQLQQAARACNVTVDVTTLSGSGMRHRVKVNPDPSTREVVRGPRGGARGVRHKYQRISASMFQNGRRVHAVCWHGFRDFFRECFKLAPLAVFKTAMDKWAGAEDFEARFRMSGHRNIGSQMAPCSAASACECGEEGYAG